MLPTQAIVPVMLLGANLLIYLHVSMFPRRAAARDWLEAEAVWNSQTTEPHRDVRGTLLTSAGLQANLVPVADSAALAIEHVLWPCFTDGDFGRFTQLRE